METATTPTTAKGKTTHYSTVEVDDAKKFGEFIIDLLENHKENVIFYLADTAVLDWFGHTIKGPKDIGAYLRNTAGCHQHHLSTPQPARRIGFRDSHLITITSKRDQYNKSSTSVPNRSTELTPTQLIYQLRTPTRMTEIGQGDGSQNDEVPESPMKRCKIDHGDGDTIPQIVMKYFSTEGHIEFRKKSSKKLQEQTKWNRPCKLEVAYCANDFTDCTIYMIIYQGNMKCRRNLLKDFESCEPSD